MKYCGNCGTRIDDKAIKCPSCDYVVVQNGDANPHFARPPVAYQGPKRLTRSRDDRVIAGVCGGIAEYFEVDSTIVRLLWILLIMMGGSGILLYVIAIIAIPEISLDPWSEPKIAKTKI